MSCAGLSQFPLKALCCDYSDFDFSGLGISVLTIELPLQSTAVTVRGTHGPSPVVLRKCLLRHFLRFVGSHQGQLYRYLLGKFIDSSILSPGEMSELEVESANLTHRHTQYRVGRL